MEQIGFFFNQTRCTGCYACIVACKDWHDIPAGPASWIKISAVEKGKFPDVYLGYLFTTCFHCGDPLCLKACPVQAITKGLEDGIVVVNTDSCIGGEECKFACLKACPYKVPQFGTESNPKMQKCDLCKDRLAEGKMPICIAACPLRALDVAPLDQFMAKYGNMRKAEGFKYIKRVNPSIVFRPKD